VVLGTKLAGLPFLPSTPRPLLQMSLWLFRLTANGYGTAIGLTRYAYWLTDACTCRSKSVNTTYRELVLIYVLNMHGLKCLNQSHLVLFLVDFAVLTADNKCMAGYWTLAVSSPPFKQSPRISPRKFGLRTASRLQNHQLMHLVLRSVVSSEKGTAVFIVTHPMCSRSSPLTNQCRSFSDPVAIPLAFQVRYARFCYSFIGWTTPWLL
jgi:hypothetical protein